jgi:hypothetical protein
MLCIKCENFDIQALYSLAARRIRDSKPRTPGVRGFPEYEGFPTFYKHYVGLAPLQASAEKGCRLCKSIWQQVIESSPIYGKDGCASSPKDGYDEQIYLGLSNWNLEAQGTPYLTVIQQLPRTCIRRIATFDIFAEQGEYSHDILTRFVPSITSPSFDTSRL